ncbi:hypothetical protein CES86_2497 [Brucella lupini]|uniref:Uncharacterized protein n=1 Tax=Brucella lupini TaxID=255457 RepID=A0A256GS19_9HYPH|nr:hypothetical protein CES86_2497 [Brucella lupini]
MDDGYPIAAFMDDEYPKAKAGKTRPLYCSSLIFQFVAL